ncbi:hypothetical protein B566_EDAN000643 [Ephemera danica]|nr:hypothetical protein B566_EDAN000643 [Ephemera danica]
MEHKSGDPPAAISTQTDGGQLSSKSDIMTEGAQKEESISPWGWKKQSRRTPKKAIEEKEGHGSLRGDEDFVDVTIACEGQSLKAHKVVLSACSQYIKKLLKENPCAHPIIILKDVALTELQALLSFMYNGQVMVEEEQIPKLLRTAELLEIRGLADLTTSSEQPAPVSTGTAVATVVERQTSSPSACAPSTKPAPAVKTDGVDGWVSGPGEGESDDEEYEDDDEEDEEELEDRMNHASLPEFSLPSDISHKPPRDLQVTTVDPTHFTPRSHIKDEQLPNKPCNSLQSHSQPHAMGDMQDIPAASRAMLPTPSQRAADIAARVSQMEDNLLPGDVLVIGETHITPARCVPRPLKPPPQSIEQPPPPKQQVSFMQIHIHHRPV